MPKDACYYKVKSRYEFSSAYASGAIAKCRKVGPLTMESHLQRKKEKQGKAERVVLSHYKMAVL